MSSAWGKSWGKSWGVAWGAPDYDEPEPPAIPAGDSIKWGLGPLVTPERRVRKKSRRKRQSEALLLVLLN